MQGFIRYFLRYHLLEAIRNGLAKATEDEDLSRSLRAEARLRLIMMPDEELWDLVKLTATSPQRPAPDMAVVDEALPNPSPSLKGTAKGGCKM